VENQVQENTRWTYNTGNFRTKEGKAGLKEHCPEAEEMAQGTWYLLILVEWFGPSPQTHKTNTAGQNVKINARRRLYTQPDYLQGQLQWIQRLYVSESGAQMWGMGWRHVLITTIVRTLIAENQNSNSP
jgi:hypothetical protein